MRLNAIVSLLSLHLQDALAEMGISQIEIAVRAGITRSQVNRAARGTVAVGYDTVDAIARVLPEHHAARILVGWLSDQIAPDLSHLVIILAAQLSTQETPALAQLPTELDPETRRRVLWLAHQAITHTAVRDALRTFESAATAVISSTRPE